jgi:hypothetical protein
MTGTIGAKSGRLLGAMLVLAAGLIAVGCKGGSGNTVFGKVYYQDKIVKGGTVVFYGKLWSAPGSIQEDGSYSLSKLPEGKVKITVDTSSFKPNPQAKEKRQIPSDAPRPPGREASADAGGDPARYTELPEKYADKNKSDLSYDVKAGKQEYDIKMK